MLSRPLVFVALFVPLAACQALPAPGGQNPFYYFFVCVTGFLVCASSQFAFSVASVLITLLRTFDTWLTLIVIMGYGSKFLQFRHKWLDYANEAAFPVYVVHQSVIVVIGYDVTGWLFGVKRSRRSASADTPTFAQRS